MSNIQGPNQNQTYPSNSYGGYSSGSPSAGENDPLAQYGTGNDQTQAYIENMHRYQQMLQSYKKMYPNDSEMISTIDNYMATSQKYLQQVGDYSSAWDPMGGLMGGGDFGMDGGMDPMGGGMGPMGQSHGQTGDVIWGDRTRVKYDGSEPVNVTVDVHGGDTRQQEFFQENFTLQIPFHGSGKSELVDDDSSPSPAKMLKVTVTMPDGSSRVYIKHNLKETDTVRILTADGDATKFAQDASLSSSPLAGAVTVGKIGEDDPSAQAGDAPDKTDAKANTRTWNKKNSVDYVVTQGKQTDMIYADQLNITMPDRSHQAYVTKTGDHDYTIEIKNEKGEVIRKIEAHQVDALNLDGVDGENVFFNDKTGKGKHETAAPAPKPKPKPPSGSAPTGGGLLTKFDVLKKDAAFSYLFKDDFKKWTDPACDTDAQLTVGGKTNDTGAGKAGQAVSAKHPEDTTADEVKGDTATYNTDKGDVKIHADFDDGVSKHNVTTSKPVTIYASNFDDKVIITHSATNTFTVEVIHSDGKKETFVLDGPPSKINIEGAVESKVTFGWWPNNDDERANAAPNGYYYVPYKAGVNPGPGPDGVVHTTLSVAGAAAAPPAPPAWPTAEVVSNVPSGGSGTKEALTLVQKMNAAFQGGSWDDVTKYLKDINDGHYWNDIIRKVMTSVFRSAGSDPNKFKALLKLIPENVRHDLRDKVIYESGEIDEQQSGDQWNSAGTAAQIDVSFQP